MTYHLAAQISHKQRAGFTASRSNHANGPVSVIMYVRWDSGVRLGTTSSERAIPRHSEIQTSVLSVFRVKYLYQYLCTICHLALIASKGCRHSAEIISETPSPDRCPPFSTKRSRRNQPDFSSRSRATADILIAYESSLSIRTQLYKSTRAL